MTRGVWVLTVGVLLPAAAAAADWPEWLGERRDGVWRETGIVKRFPNGGPKVLWRTPLAAGYSGPAVAKGRVYVMDRVRPLGADGKPARVTRDGIPGKERVLCLDAKTGKQIWKHEYDCHYRVSYPSGPRVTPLVRGGRVYTLGTMGDLYCLDEKTGKPIWHKNLMKAYGLEDPPVWGYAAHPLLEGDLLYTLVGGKGSAVVALHKDTGMQVWKALTTQEVGYSPPMLVEAGGKKQLLVWLSESLNGLDPKTGKPYWSLKYPADRDPERPAVNIISVVPHGRLLLVSTGYHGTMAVELDKDTPEAKALWRGKSHNMGKPDGLHALMATPVVKDGHIYGTGAWGELLCVEAKTGKVKWQTFELNSGKKSFCGTAFIVPQGDRFVVFSDLGELSLVELSPKGHKVISRAKVIEPPEKARDGRMVVWSHPAFADKCAFVRNDKEMVCLSLAE